MPVDSGETVRIESLGREHDRQSFSCGVPELDLYLWERAVQDMKRNLATVFVLVDEGSTVIGYYTLSQQAITTGELPEEMARRLPRYTLIPATLIGRFAIDVRCQRQGLGRMLLGDALFRIWRAAQSVASYAVRADATNESALDFYIRCGFIVLPGERLKLFLPMGTLDRHFTGIHRR